MEEGAAHAGIGDHPNCDEQPLQRPEHGPPEGEPDTCPPCKTDLWTHQFRGEENLLVHCGMAKWWRAAARELRSIVSGAVPRDAHAPTREPPCPNV